MHFLRSSNLLILVGGRRNGVRTGTDMNAEFIKETHILNVKTLEWSILKFAGTPLAGIYNFASCLKDDDDLYIFGGTEEPLHHNQKLFRIRKVIEEKGKGK